MGGARLAPGSRQDVSSEHREALPTRLKAESLDRRVRTAAKGLAGTTRGLADTEQPRDVLPPLKKLPGWRSCGSRAPGRCTAGIEAAVA